jgi:plastocyanin
MNILKKLNRIALGSLAATIVLVICFWVIGDFIATAQVDGNDSNIAVMDDCLPGDPAWNPTGGCGLKPHQGDVSMAEFDALLRSPLTIPPNAFLIGHPSWRNEPSCVTVKAGKAVHVRNRGGRGHTFTEVADFGGGIVPPLKIGLSQAPQCNQDAIPLAPGATVTLTSLAPGLHKSQCCIHPWMRATIRVE